MERGGAHEECSVCSLSFCGLITPVCSSNFGFTLVRDEPLAIGGCNPKGVVRDCEVFEWRANRWRDITALRTGRSGMTAICLDEWELDVFAHFD